MDSNRSLWVVIGLYSSLWSLMGPIGSLSVLFSSLWVLMGPYASIWIVMVLMGPYASIVLMRPYGSLHVLMRRYGF